MTVKHFVLLPGLDGTGQLFSPLIELLSPHFTTTVVRYPVNEPLSYRELIPYVQAALPTDQPYVLLAESFSGPLAIEVAAKNPSHLQALILCASFVRNPLPGALHWTHSLVNQWWFHFPLPKFAIKTFLLGSNCPHALVWQVAKVIRSVQPSVLSLRVQEVMKVEATESLRLCHLPMLYLLGKQDRLVRANGWQQISKIRPDTKLVEIDGPHLLLQRQPSKALDVFREFLSEIEVR